MSLELRLGLRAGWLGRRIEGRLDLSVSRQRWRMSEDPQPALQAVIAVDQDTTEMWIKERKAVAELGKAIAEACDSKVRRLLHEQERFGYVGRRNGCCLMK